jgi:hypothetical protein
MEAFFPKSQIRGNVPAPTNRELVGNKYVRMVTHKQKQQELLEDVVSWQSSRSCLRGLRLRVQTQ